MGVGRNLAWQVAASVLLLGALQLPTHADAPARRPPTRLPAAPPLPSAVSRGDGRCRGDAPPPARRVWVRG
eukprot:gene45925-39686_t